MFASLSTPGYSSVLIDNIMVDLDYLPRGQPVHPGIQILLHSKIIPIPGVTGRLPWCPKGLCVVSYDVFIRKYWWIFGGFCLYDG